MKNILLALILAAPSLAAAQPVLDIPNDFHFDAGTVERAADRTYRARTRSLAASGRLDTDAALLARLQRLAAALDVAARFEIPGAAAVAWEIHTCRGCGENASAMAGGRILIGEEFIQELLPTDAELGYLLAHEMAHVLAQHTREFISVARYFVDNGRDRDYEDIENELDDSLAVGLRMATVFAQQEIEADYIGFVLGARIGLDPEAMPRLLGKLHTDLSQSFSLHPDNARRLRLARAMLESARRIHAAGIQTP